MKKYVLSIALGLFCMVTAYSNGPKPKLEFYELRVYSLADNSQLSSVENYLENALVPALKKQGIPAVGVFTAIANDTAAVKKLYVLIPLRNAEQAAGYQQKLDADNNYLQKGSAYLNAAHDHPPFLRQERILLKAFSDHPVFSKPGWKNDPAERVYELRSYEGPTENLYANKVQMFNKGGEVKLFDRLGFHAVFYAEVLYGSRMPNLMYMTTFENMDKRNEHWKAFGNDPEWKTLSSMPEYQNNVSKADILFLKPTAYSDL